VDKVGSDRSKATREAEHVRRGIKQRGDRQAGWADAILAEIPCALAHRQYLDRDAGCRQSRDERTVLGQDDVGVDLVKRVEESRKGDLTA
jgi:hypothetical protein